MVELLTMAIEKEESTTYMYGPPDIVKPSHEMYAEWLERNNKKKEAIVHFNKVLERAPGRYFALNAIESLKG